MSNMETPGLNESGDLLMVLLLDGADVTGANDRAVYFATDPGDVMLLLREGDFFESASGDMGTVRGFAAHGGSASERGFRIALNVDFDGGSEGIFFATVPEPSSAWPALLGLAALGSRRRRDLCVLPDSVLRSRVSVVR